MIRHCCCVKYYPLRKLPPFSYREKIIQIHQLYYYDLSLTSRTMHDLKHLKGGNFGIDAKRQTLSNIYYQKILSKGAVVQCDVSLLNSYKN